MCTPPPPSRRRQHVPDDANVPPCHSRPPTAATRRAAKSHEAVHRRERSSSNQFKQASRLARCRRKRERENQSWGGAGRRATRQLAADRRRSVTMTRAPAGARTAACAPTRPLAFTNPAGAQRSRREAGGGGRRLLAPLAAGLQVWMPGPAGRLLAVGNQQTRLASIPSTRRARPPHRRP